MNKIASDSLPDEQCCCPFWVVSDVGEHEPGPRGTYCPTCKVIRLHTRTTLWTALNMMNKRTKRGTITPFPPAKRSWQRTVETRYWDGDNRVDWFDAQMRMHRGGVFYSWNYENPAHGVIIINMNSRRSHALRCWSSRHPHVDVITYCQYCQYDEERQKVFASCNGTDYDTLVPGAIPPAIEWNSVRNAASDVPGTSTDAASAPEPRSPVSIPEYLPRKV